MIYELIDIQTANLIGTYDTEAEALAVVRAAIERHGPTCVETLALGCEDRRGRGKQIARGTALVARALATTPPERPSSRPASPSP